MFDVGHDSFEGVAPSFPGFQALHAMADKAEDKHDEENQEGDELPDTQDIFYVCKKTLESLKEKIKKSEEITKECVSELTSPENLADEEMMVPVDMRGVAEKVGKDFDDVDMMVDELGAKGTADAFLAAAEYFAANKDKEPEDERPQPMTAKEWRKILEENDEGEDVEEEELLEDEEEEAEGDFAEEEELGDEDGDEPPAKKSKTG